MGQWLSHVELSALHPLNIQIIQCILLLNCIEAKVFDATEEQRFRLRGLTVRASGKRRGETERGYYSSHRLFVKQVKWQRTYTVVDQQDPGYNAPWNLLYLYYHKVQKTKGTMVPWLATTVTSCFRMFSQGGTVILKAKGPPYVCILRTCSFSTCALLSARSEFQSLVAARLFTCSHPFN